jgi:rfaE bifunctional protein nucleotidyltransferase chain/domain
MKKILSIDEVAKVTNELHEINKTIVLAGGCFDILHVGHITFLEQAKHEGDVLMLLLESDAVIRKQKGDNRPVNTQRDRAVILAALEVVDYVVLLPETVDNTFYDSLVNQLKPAIIATTAGDRNRMHKERQAAMLGAKVIDVTPEIKDQSTSRIIKFLDEL